MTLCHLTLPDVLVLVLAAIGLARVLHGAWVICAYGIGGRS